MHSSQRSDLEKTHSLPRLLLSDKNKVSVKNYVIGSAGGSIGSFLGSEELDKVIPGRHLKIQVLTWNLSMKSPKITSADDLFQNFLFYDKMNLLPDIYFICTQENPKEKSNYFNTNLQATLGHRYLLFHHFAVGALQIAIFMVRDLIWYTSVPQSNFVPFNNSLKTKGAIGVCFILFGTSFLIINSHFIPHHGNLEKRIDNYNQTRANINIPKSSLSAGYNTRVKRLEDKFHYIIWAGDLNFRIKTSRSKVENILKDPKLYEWILESDELLDAQVKNKAFQIYSEGLIKFPPTFKYDPGCHSYDTSDKQRTPSYTDRILFHSRIKNGIRCLFYDSQESVVLSDHRPVVGLFDIIIHPGRDNIALSAGNYSRQTYIDGLQLRAIWLDIKKHKTLKSQIKNFSAICNLQ